MEYKPFNEVRDMFFRYNDATPADISYNLSIVLNNVGNQLRAIMDALSDDATVWNINHSTALVAGAAALLLQAEPYLLRLDAMAADAERAERAYTPAPLEASPTRFDGAVPASTRNA